MTEDEKQETESDEDEESEEAPEKTQDFNSVGLEMDMSLAPSL